jgi:hypothetical protein
MHFHSTCFISCFKVWQFWDYISSTDYIFTSRKRNIKGVKCLFDCEIFVVFVWEILLKMKGVKRVQY